MTVATEFGEFVATLEGHDNVSELSAEEVAERARHFGRPTVYGGLGFFSNVRNRGAAFSVVIGSHKVETKNLTDRQKAILGKLTGTLRSVESYLKIAPLVCVKRTIGQNDSFNPKCTLYLSTQRRDNIRQAYLWANTLRDYQGDAPGPELKVVCIPEWPEQDRQVLIFPEERLTIILGSDYVGEVKMSFLRMAMWEAKQRGMLGLHAGSKLVTARDKGGVKRFGMLLFGLSGTGKTTHSCQDHGLNGDGEGIDILQDDIVFLGMDGSALGTEQGFYLKTEGLEPGNHPIIYKALCSPHALHENGMVDYQGNVDFANLTLGSNGRAVIPRYTLAPYVGEDINMPPLGELDGLIIAFITRRMTVLPVASKLTIEQAAASFMLGESVETSAGDPLRAGQSVRVVGTNPFLIGDEAEEGNWFYEFLKTNADKVQCYLLNTGGVGEIMERDERGHPVVTQKVLRIAIGEMAALIRGIVRGSIDWEKDPQFGAMAPHRVEGMVASKFSLDNFYTHHQIDDFVTRLKSDRREWLSRFPGLQQEIVEAYQ